jgi:hypothetical protein
VAVMVPQGLVVVHFPREEGEGEMVVMGVWVWRLRDGGRPGRGGASLVCRAREWQL